MTGALASPDDVAEPGGGVVEGADFEAWVKGGGDEGVATAQAGAEDAELLVALLFEPVDAAADVDDCLAAGFGGAAYVGADGVVGALQLGGAADVVVGLGEAKAGDAEVVEEGAESVVREGVGVPLGHDDHGLFGFAFLGFGVGGVPACVDGIVFGVASTDGRGEPEERSLFHFAGLGLSLEFGVLFQRFGADVGGEELGVAFFEAEVGGGGVAEELVGASDDVAVDGDHALVVVG